MSSITQKSSLFGIKAENNNLACISQSVIAQKSGRVYCQYCIGISDISAFRHIHLKKSLSITALERRTIITFQQDAWEHDERKYFVQTIPRLGYYTLFSFWIRQSSADPDLCWSEFLKCSRFLNFIVPILGLLEIVKIWCRKNIASLQNMAFYANNIPTWNIHSVYIFGHHTMVYSVDIASSLLHNFGKMLCNFIFIYTHCF